MFSLPPINPDLIPRVVPPPLPPPVPIMGDAGGALPAAGAWDAPGGNGGGKGKGKRTCLNCGGVGHWARDCGSYNPMRDGKGGAKGQYGRRSN